MKDMDDLFGDPAVAAGKTDTSIKAARKVQTKAARIRGQILRELRRVGDLGATPSECAARLHIDILSVRPRTTELKDMGRIRDSGKRRENSRHNDEIVWVLADAAPMEQAA